MKLKNRLHYFRSLKQKVSQQALANAVGVSRLTIHSVEKGKFTPSALLALKIAQFFKVKFEDIFFLAQEKNEKTK